MRRALPILASSLLALGLVAGTAAAANPNASYTLTACWDGTGVVGTGTWFGVRVTAMSFAFENYALAADYFTVEPARDGSGTSGSFTPQVDGGDFVGYVYIQRHVVGTDSIPEPGGGWSSLPACGGA